MTEPAVPEPAAPDAAGTSTRARTGRHVRHQARLQWPGEDRQRKPDDDFAWTQRRTRARPPSIHDYIKGLYIGGLGILGGILGITGLDNTGIVLAWVFLVGGTVSVVVSLYLYRRALARHEDELWRLSVARRGNLHRSNPGEYEALEDLHAKRVRMSQALRRGELAETDPDAYEQVKGKTESLRRARSVAWYHSRRGERAFPERPRHPEGPGTWFTT